MTESYEDIGILAGETAAAADAHDNIDDLRAAYIGACTRASYFFKTLQDVRADLEAALQRNRDKDDELRRRGRQLDAWQDATGARTADDASDLRRSVDERLAVLDALGLDHSASAEEVVEEIENLVELNRRRLESKAADVEEDGTNTPQNRSPDVGDRLRITGPNQSGAGFDVGDVVEVIATDASGAQVKRRSDKRVKWLTLFSDDYVFVEDDLDEDPRPLKAGQKVRITGGKGVYGFDVGDVVEVAKATNDVGDTLLVRGDACSYLWAETECELVEDVEPAEIEVGDRVRVLKDRPKASRLLVGDIVEVLRMPDFDGDYYVKAEDGCLWYVPEGDVELVE